MRRIGEGRIDSGNVNDAVFERLAEHFEDGARKFRELVQKEDASMRERHFAGARYRAAADEARHGNRVMRASERPLGNNFFCFEKSGDAVNFRDFERFFARHGRENRRDAAREHRFPGAGRAAHDDIVRAGGRNFHRAFGDDLSLHVGEIDIAPRRFLLFAGDGGGEDGAAVQKFHDFGERLHAVDGDIFAKERFIGRFGRDENRIETGFFPGEHHGKDARDGADFSLERKFADEKSVPGRFLRHLIAGGENADGNRKIQPGAVFFEIGRRQIHRDFIRRKPISGIADGRAHAFFRFFDGRGGKPHDIKSGKLRIDVDLDGDDVTGEAERDGSESLSKHGTSLGNVSEKISFFLYDKEIRAAFQVLFKFPRGEREEEKFERTDGQKSVRRADCFYNAGNEEAPRGRAAQKDESVKAHDAAEISGLRRELDGRIAIDEEKNDEETERGEERHGDPNRGGARKKHEEQPRCGGETEERAAIRAFFAGGGKKPARERAAADGEKNRAESVDAEVQNLIGEKRTVRAEIHDEGGNDAQHAQVSHNNRIAFRMKETGFDFRPRIFIRRRRGRLIHFHVKVQKENRKKGHGVQKENHAVIDIGQERRGEKRPDHARDIEIRGI